MPSKTSDGTLVFKIVYWGPSLGGKTTSVKWLHSNEGKLVDGALQSITDPTGRTLFFDRLTAGVAGVKFQIWTVAGQKRHKYQRKVILQGVDGIIFVWDSAMDQLEENMYSLKELKEFLGDKLGREIPFILMLNKRDVDNPISKEKVKEILNEMGLGNTLIYETVAIKGENVRRAFLQICREAVLKHYASLKPLSSKTK
ncbi:MAG: GTP-binding protein [Candidatus Odinarchaeia archaeon]